MNRGKGAMSAIINEREVIFSSTDKVKLISIFPSNWTIDQEGHHLPKSPRNSEYNLSNILITAWKVSRHFKINESKTATGPDKIPMIFHRNIRPGLFQIRAKLFNCYLKYESFSSLRRVKRIPGFQEGR